MRRVASKSSRAIWFRKHPARTDIGTHKGFFLIGSLVDEGDRVTATSSKTGEVIVAQVIRRHDAAGHGHHIQVRMEVPDGRET